MHDFQGNIIGIAANARSLSSQGELRVAFSQSLLGELALRDVGIIAEKADRLAGRLVIDGAHDRRNPADLAVRLDGAHDRRNPANLAVWANDAKFKGERLLPATHCRILQRFDPCNVIGVHAIAEIGIARHTA